MAPVVNDIRLFIVSVLYAVLGMVLLWIGYRLFDLITPTDMQKKIFEEGNVAVAITVGAFILGVAIVVGAAIHG